MRNKSKTKKQLFWTTNIYQWIIEIAYFTIFTVYGSLTWSFVVIRFDTPDIRWLFGHQDIHQLCQAGLELCGCLYDNVKELEYS